MANPKIPGGYYLKARIIKEKTIAHCSPCVREIWDYLLREVTYKNKGSLKRGQLFIRYQDVMDDLKWFVGYRKMTYSMDQTKKAMKVLRRHLMITTTKARNGVLVTLLNYDFYNDLKNYEGTNEGTDESTNEGTDVPPTINKKLKKGRRKELKDIILKPESVTEQTWNDFLTHRKNKKANVTQTVLNTFIKQSEIAGVTLENAMIECVSRGWTGFKAEWINKNNIHSGNEKMSLEKYKESFKNKINNPDYTFKDQSMNKILKEYPFILEYDLDSKKFELTYNKYLEL